jgi:outer membrane protein assembly factor BamB
MTYREPPAGPRVVVFAKTNRVMGLDVATGTPVWRFEFPPDPGGEFPVRLAIAGEAIYALARHWLACIHVPTGRVIGQVRTAGAFGRPPGTLLVAGSCVLVGQSSRLQCFTQDGRLLWETEAGGEIALAFGDAVAQADVDS